MDTVRYPFQLGRVQVWFQLGHDFSAMDTPITGVVVPTSETVSIGPRLFSHGYSEVCLQDPPN